MKTPVVALNAAIEIDPKKPEPYVLLADVYIAQEKYEEAEIFCSRAMRQPGVRKVSGKKQTRWPETPFIILLISKLMM